MWFEILDKMKPTARSLRAGTNRLRM